MATGNRPQDSLSPFLVSEFEVQEFGFFQTNTAKFFATLSIIHDWLCLVSAFHSPKLDICASSVQLAISLTTPPPSLCLINSPVRWNKYLATFSTYALNFTPVSCDNVRKASDQVRYSSLSPGLPPLPNPFLTQATMICELRATKNTGQVPLDNFEALWQDLEAFEATQPNHR